MIGLQYGPQNLRYHQRPWTLRQRVHLAQVFIEKMKSDDTFVRKVNDVPPHEHGWSVWNATAKKKTHMALEGRLLPLLRCTFVHFGVVHHKLRG